MSRLGPLAERDFRILFLARSTSLLGSAVAPIALVFAVLDDLGGSPTDLGLVLAATWVPEILLTLIGGVWADRLPRNLLMVGTDLLLFAVQAAAAVLLLTDSARLWHLVALGALRGVAEAFFFPAIQGVVPDVVSAARLQEANAVLRLAENGLRIGGSAAAGAFVAAFGSGWVLGFDAATFLGSAAFLIRIRLPRSPRAGGGTVLAELREGWDEFWSRTWLWTIVVSAAVGNMVVQAGINVLGPVVAKQSLGGPAAWGVIVAAQASGYVLGALATLRFRPERLLLVGCAGLLLAVPPFALLALAAPVGLIVGASVVSGFGLELFTVYWITALQQQIPSDRLSRVSAYDALGSFVAIPIGLTAAGPVAAVIGVSTTIWAAGAVAFVSLAPLLAVRDIRTLRRTT